MLTNVRSGGGKNKTTASVLMASVSPADVSGFFCNEHTNALQAVIMPEKTAEKHLQVLDHHTI